MKTTTATKTFVDANVVSSVSRRSRHVVTEAKKEREKTFWFIRIGAKGWEVGRSSPPDMGTFKKKKSWDVATGKRFPS